MHIKNLKVITERVNNRMYNFQINRGSKKENTINLLESRKDFLKRNNKKARKVENTKQNRKKNANTPVTTHTHR